MEELILPLYLSTRVYKSVPLQPRSSTQLHKQLINNTPDEILAKLADVGAIVQVFKEMTKGTAAGPSDDSVNFLRDTFLRSDPMPG